MHFRPKASLYHPPKAKAPWVRDGMEIAACKGQLILIIPWVTKIVNFGFFKLSFTDRILTKGLKDFDTLFEECAVTEWKRDMYIE